MQSLFFISRPFEGSITGTGEQIVAKELITEFRTILGNEHISFCKKRLVKPYHSFLSILYYDWLLQLCYLIRNIVNHHEVVVFNSPYQAVFSGFFSQTSHTVCIVHDVFMDDYGRKSMFDKYSLFVYRLAFKNCHAIITTTIENANKIQAVYAITPIVCALGVRDVAINTGDTNTEKVVGYIGSYAPRKRPELLEALVAQSPHEYQFIFAGSMPDIIQQRFAHYDNVHVLGIISETQKTEFYKSITFLYMPSALEGFGLPLIEAMRSRVLPIVHIDADIPSIVKKNCATVESTNDVQRLIRSLCADNEKLLNTLKANYTASEQFNWQVFAQKVLTI